MTKNPSSFCQRILVLLNNSLATEFDSLWTLGIPNELDERPVPQFQTKQWRISPAKGRGHLPKNLKDWKLMDTLWSPPLFVHSYPGKTPWPENGILIL